MVATRNHPKDFPEPETATAQPQESPRKRATRTSTANHASPTETASPAPTTTTTKTRTATASTSAPPRSFTVTSTRPSAGGAWSHTPSNLTLIWLAISLPLVIWDTLYVVLRPYSMPGGFLHKPIWTPYGLYGTIDHVYGFKAYNAHNGWTAAQGTVNAIETAAYLVYLYIVYVYGEQEPRQGAGAPDRSAMGQLRALSESRTVRGRVATWAVILAYSTASLTFWKTVLYWLNEAYSGFDNIGHNDWATLFFMWIVPNGAWIALPAYMMYVFGKETLEGLEVAATKKARY